MNFRTWYEGLSREGQNEYVGKYVTSGGKIFEVWLRIVDKESARITYLRGYGNGSGSFEEVIPDFLNDIKKLGIKNIDYSTAIDDKTGGRARDRLFAKWKNKYG